MPVDTRTEEQNALDHLRSSGALVDMVEMAALLELSRLTAARLDLPSYTQAVLDVVSQFFRLDGCVLTVEVPNLPALRASFGVVPGEEGLRAETCTGGSVDTEGVQAHPLRLGGTVTGMIAGALRPGSVGGRGFFPRAADQLSATLDILAEAELLRRRAATADALHLAGSVTSLDGDVVDKLASALAALPGAAGAVVGVQPDRLAVPLTCCAGLTDASLPATLRSLRADDIEVEVRLAWAAAPTEGEVAVLDRVLDALAGALGRAGERRRLENEVETDPLTGVGNRRRAGRALGAALRRAARFGEPLALVSFDVDHFKRVNDRLGHPVGDEVLAAVGAVLESQRRGYDTAARMGGEEFLLICPGCDALGAVEVAERVRAAITEAGTPLVGELGRLTASAGVAVYPDAGETPDELLRRADQALYDAKTNGRDRVAVAHARVVGAGRNS